MHYDGTHRSRIINNHSSCTIGRHAIAITKGIPDSLWLFSSWRYFECVPGFPVVQILRSLENTNVQPRFISHIYSCHIARTVMWSFSLLSPLFKKEITHYEKHLNWFWIVCNRCCGCSLPRSGSLRTNRQGSTCRSSCISDYFRSSCTNRTDDCVVWGGNPRR